MDVAPSHRASFSDSGKSPSLRHMARGTQPVGGSAGRADCDSVRCVRASGTLCFSIATASHRFGQIPQSPTGKAPAFLRTAGDAGCLSSNADSHRIATLRVSASLAGPSGPAPGSNLGPGPVRAAYATHSIWHPVCAILALVSLTTPADCRTSSTSVRLKGPSIAALDTDRNELPQKM